MTGRQRNPPQTTGPASPSPDDAAMLAQPFLEAQRAQWKAWLSWQQSLATFNKDLWEQWAVRYGGGSPFDG